MLGRQSRDTEGVLVSLVPCQNLGRGRLLQSRDKMNNAEYGLNNLSCAFNVSCPLPLPRVQTNCHAPTIRALGWVCCMLHGSRQDLDLLW